MSILSSLLGDYADDIAKAASKVATNNTDDLAKALAKGFANKVDDETITLYRGLTQPYDKSFPVNRLDTSGYESWTDNLNLAKQYGDNVYSITVPKSDIKASYLDENPLSPTYGDRNPIYRIDKKAGLNGVSGNEFLLEVGSPYQENLKYNEVPSLTKIASNDKFDKLLKKAKNYKSAERFEKMNNPIKGSEIWGEKPTSIFQRDSRAVRVNMFPNDATKGTGITKQYLLNLFKDAYDQGITDIVPSYGIYTKDGASFMNHLAEQGWVNSVGRNGVNSYTIAPKITEWARTNPLVDIYNEANNNISSSILNGLIKK